MSFRSIPLVLCALAVSFSALGSDAVGILRSECPPFRYILKITSFKGHQLKHLELGIFAEPEVYEKDWNGAPAFGDAQSARIQIVHFSRRWWQLRISGNFEVVMKDGRKLQGSFKAKYGEPPRPYLCA